MKLTTLVEWPLVTFCHTVIEPANSYDVMYAYYSITGALVDIEFSATLPV